jgi:alkylresorcinol/alkylpyrone synthase
VLDHATRALGIEDDALAPARAVLRSFGNMSAPVIFVLEEVLRRRAPGPGEWGLMIALGPGFAAEGALLRW